MHFKADQEAPLGPLFHLPCPNVELRPSSSPWSTALPACERIKLKLGRRLGQGAFADVHKALIDSNVFAVKVLRPDYAANMQAVRMLTREAALLGALNHPHIVRCRGLFGAVVGRSTSPAPVMVMEYLEGGSLADLLARQAVLGPGKGEQLYTDEEALTWMLQVAEALAYLHGHSPAIIHRDVKLANVLLAPAGPSGSSGAPGKPVRRPSFCHLLACRLAGGGGAGGRGARMVAKLCDFGLQQVVRPTDHRPMVRLSGQLARASASGIFHTPRQSGEGGGLLLPPAVLAACQRLRQQQQLAAVSGGGVGGGGVGVPSAASFSAGGASADVGVTSRVGSLLATAEGWGAGLVSGGSDGGAGSGLLSSGQVEDGRWRQTGGCVEEEEAEEEGQGGVAGARGIEGPSGGSGGVAPAAMVAASRLGSMMSAGVAAAAAALAAVAESYDRHAHRQHVGVVPSLNFAIGDREAIVNTPSPTPCAVSSPQQFFQPPPQLRPTCSDSHPYSRPYIGHRHASAVRCDVNGHYCQEHRVEVAAPQPPPSSPSQPPPMATPAASSSGGGVGSLLFGASRPLHAWIKRHYRRLPHRQASCPRLNMDAGGDDCCNRESASGCRTAMVAAALIAPLPPSRVALLRRDEVPVAAWDQLSGYGRGGAAAMVGGRRCASFVDGRGGGGAGFSGGVGGHRISTEVAALLWADGMAVTTNTHGAANTTSTTTDGGSSVPRASTDSCGAVPHAGHLSTHKPRSHSFASVPCGGPGRVVAMLPLAAPTATAGGGAGGGAVFPFSHGSPLLERVFPFSGQCGSSIYMAPEVAQELPYNDKADVFSFGLVLFEVTCRTLIGLTQEGRDGLAFTRMLVSGRRPQLAPSCDPRLAAVIRACWHADPLERPTMSQVVQVLRSILYGSTTDGATSTTTATAPTAATSAAPLITHGWGNQHCATTTPPADTASVLNDTPFARAIAISAAAVSSTTAPCQYPRAGPVTTTQTTTTNINATATTEASTHNVRGSSMTNNATPYDPPNRRSTLASQMTSGDAVPISSETLTSRTTAPFCSQNLETLSSSATVTTTTTITTTLSSATATAGVSGDGVSGGGAAIAGSVMCLSKSPSTREGEDRGGHQGLRPHTLPSDSMAAAGAAAAAAVRAGVEPHAGREGVCLNATEEALPKNEAVTNVQAHLAVETFVRTKKGVIPPSVLSGGMDDTTLEDAGMAVNAAAATSDGAAFGDRDGSNRLEVTNRASCGQGASGGGPQYGFQQDNKQNYVEECRHSQACCIIS